MRVAEFSDLPSFNLGLDLFGHQVSGNDGGQETFTLALESWTQTLRTTNQEPDHQVGILLNGLT